MWPQSFNDLQKLLWEVTRALRDTKNGYGESKVRGSSNQSQVDLLFSTNQLINTPGIGHKVPVSLTRGHLEHSSLISSELPYRRSSTISALRSHQVPKSHMHLHDMNSSLILCPRIYTEGVVIPLATPIHFTVGRLLLDHNLSALRRSKAYQLPDLHPTDIFANSENHARAKFNRLSLENIRHQDVCS